MTYALVAHLAGFSASSNTFTTSSIDTTGADLLVVCVSDSAHATVLSDSKSNTWTGLTIQSFGQSCQLYYAKNATVGTGHTFTATGTGIFATLSIAAFSGSNLTAPYDTPNENGAQGAGVTSLATGSVTPSVANSLVVTGLESQGGTTYTANGGFTVTDSTASGTFGYEGAALAYLIQTSAAAANPTWSWTGSGNATTRIATFKPGAAAAAQVPYNPWLQRAPILAS